MVERRLPLTAVSCQEEGEKNMDCAHRLKPLGLVLLAALVFAMPGRAQRSWQHTFGGADYDFGTCARQTSDDGFIVAGSWWSGVPSSAVCLIKTDAAGNDTWGYSYTLANSDLEGNSVCETPDGRYVVAGTMWDNSTYSCNALLYKFDHDGNSTRWLAMGGDSLDYFNCVRVARDGNYIIAGQSQFPGSNWKVWLVKTDTAFGVLWEHLIGDFWGQSVGNDVWPDDDGGYSIAATTTLESSVMSDVYVIKTDASGDTTWSRRYGAPDRDYGYSIQQTSDHGYVVAGGSQVYQEGEDVYLVRTNSSGDTLWTRVYGGSDDQEGRSVRQAPDGGFIIAGWTESGAGGKDVYLVKTDANGNRQWERTFGGANDDLASSVEPTRDGGYIVAGTTSSFGAGAADVWLIRTDASGNIGIDEQRRTPGLFPHAAATTSTIVRGVLLLQETRGEKRDSRCELLDITGRKALDLRPGANDVSRLAPGVYYIVTGPNSGRAQKIIKTGRE